MATRLSSRTSHPGKMTLALFCCTSCISYRWMTSFPCLLGVLFVAASGCNDEIGGWSTSNQSRFERTITRQITLDSADTLDVLSRAGTITVTGADVTDCNLVARVVAQAPTEEEAQEIAEQVQIVGEAAGSTMKIRSEEPDLPNNRWIGVNYTITIPRRMNIRGDSAFGRLDISHIDGRLDGKSGNGSIKAQDIRGRTELRTSFGAIECRDVTGSSITLHSGNGRIVVAGLRGPVTAETSFGAIACEDVTDGDLRLKSGNGKIEITNASFGVCEARSSFGAIAGNGLKGDSITLGSGNGNVEVDNVQAKTLDLSSSFGSLRATNVTASSLSAESGNGGIRIACSPSTGADLHARVRSSFGSVDFTAPAGFSGEVDLSTDFGSIRTSLPVTVSGEISRSKVAGRIGDGTGSIHIKTGNGSVELK